MIKVYSWLAFRVLASTITIGICLYPIVKDSPPEAWDTYAYVVGIVLLAVYYTEIAALKDTFYRMNLNLAQQAYEGKFAKTPDENLDAYAYFTTKANDLKVGDHTRWIFSFALSIISFLGMLFLLAQAGWLNWIFVPISLLAGFILNVVWRRVFSYK